MTQKPQPHRPARAAIAAVLALSTTALTPAIAFAQVIEPATQAPAETATPSTKSAAQSTAQPAPVMSAPVPNTQPPSAASITPVAPTMATPKLALPSRTATISAPTNPIERAARTAEAAPAKDSAPIERKAVRTVASATEPTTKPSIDTTPVATNDAGDSASPMALTLPDPDAANVTNAPDQADQTPADVATAPASDSSNEWAWLAGLAALIGLGGALAISRTARQRKTHVRSLAAEDVVTDNTPPDATLTQYAPIAVEPTHAKQTPPLAERPAAYDSVERVALMPGRKVGAIGEPVDRPLLEAMIAQPPSETNPFLTRANRKRRALFLMRKGLETGTRPSRTGTQRTGRQSELETVETLSRDRFQFRLQQAKEHESV